MALVLLAHTEWGPRYVRGEGGGLGLPFEM